MISDFMTMREPTCFGAKRLQRCAESARRDNMYYMDYTCVVSFVYMLLHKYECTIPKLMSASLEETRLIYLWTVSICVHQDDLSIAETNRAQLNILYVDTVK